MLHLHSTVCKTCVQRSKIYLQLLVLHIKKDFYIYFSQYKFALCEEKKIFCYLEIKKILERNSFKNSDKTIFFLLTDRFLSKSSVNHRLVYTYYLSQFILWLWPKWIFFECSLIWRFVSTRWLWFGNGFGKCGHIAQWSANAPSGIR